MKIGEYFEIYKEDFKLCEIWSLQNTEKPLFKGKFSCCKNEKYRNLEVQGITEHDDFVTIYTF